MANVLEEAASIMARAVVAFAPGDNDTDTIIAGSHYNLTTLHHWNYTLYSNNTISNRSRCYLTFPPYDAKGVLDNGTFINSTRCYGPINPIGNRGKASIAFSVFFGICLVLTLVCLGKHGRLYLPAEKRFYPIGRRWQWYYGSAVCVAALISLITNVDVDRYYIVELPIVLFGFFWYLMQMCTMALVWEATRHWGSWMERQYIDPNPFILDQNDRRSMFELIVPIVFYFFVWMNFFLIVPRNWGAIELQRSAEQAAAKAIPNATDSRFKAATFMLLIAWLITLVYLRHSISHYTPRHTHLIDRIINTISATPYRLLLLLGLSLIMIAFQGLVAWEWDYSPLNAKGDNVAIYVGGFLPMLLVLIIQLLYGWVARNEDKELIRQRRIRGEESDRILGITRKPAWWSRAKGDIPINETMRDRIARNVREVGGGAVTTQNINRTLEQRDRDNDAVELNEFSGPQYTGPESGRRNSGSSARTGRSTRTFETYGGKSDQRRYERTVQAAASLLFPNADSTGAGTAVDRRAELTMDGPPPPYNDSGRGRPNELSGSRRRNGRSSSVDSVDSLAAAPQQVRSMLDI